jgi:magnesium-transporting ATPase (P-type)
MKATKTNSQRDSWQLMESTLPLAFWALSPDQLLQQLHTCREGLTEEEAAARLRQYGANVLHRSRSESKRTIVLRQFTNPIVLILIAAALLSGVLGDATDTLIILAIVLLSGLLGFWVADWSQSNFARNPNSKTPKRSFVADWSQSNLPTMDED